MSTLHATPTAHIRVDDRGVAFIDDLRFKVVHIVREHLSGASPREIHEAHKSVLSLAQVYAALSYYYDHKEQVDQQIRQSDLAASQALRELPDPPGLDRLREIKSQRSAERLR